jgi:hypothetical protein
MPGFFIQKLLVENKVERERREDQSTQIGPGRVTNEPISVEDKVRLPEYDLYTWLTIVD